MDSKNMNNSAKTGLSWRFCPKRTENCFYSSLSTRHRYTKQYLTHPLEVPGLEGHSTSPGSVEAAGTPRGCRRGWGDPRLSLCWLSSAETGGDRNAPETETNSCTPMEHRKPGQSTTDSSANNPIWISDIYYELDLILPAQSWQRTVFGSFQKMILRTASSIPKSCTKARENKLPPEKEIHPQANHRL